MSAYNTNPTSSFPSGSYTIKVNGVNLAKGKKTDLYVKVSAGVYDFEIHPYKPNAVTSHSFTAPGNCVVNIHFQVWDDNVIMADKLIGTGNTPLDTVGHGIAKQVEIYDTKQKMLGYISYEITPGAKPLNSTTMATSNANGNIGVSSVKGSVSAPSTTAGPNSIANTSIAGGYAIPQGGYPPQPQQQMYPQQGYPPQQPMYQQPPPQPVYAQPMYQQPPPPVYAQPMYQQPYPPQQTVYVQQAPPPPQMYVQPVVQPQTVYVQPVQPQTVYVQQQPTVVYTSHKAHKHHRW